MKEASTPMRRIVTAAPAAPTPRTMGLSDTRLAAEVWETSMASTKAAEYRGSEHGRHGPGVAAPADRIGCWPHGIAISRTAAGGDGYNGADINESASEISYSGGGIAMQSYFYRVTKDEELTDDSKSLKS